MDKTETNEGPPGWHADRFEPPRRASPTATRPRRRAEVSDALVRWGAAALERAHASDDWVDLRDAGWLLGGLTRGVVVAVLGQFQERAPASLDRGIQRLGELCGALFLEHLCATRELLLPKRPRLEGTRKAAALGRWLTRTPHDFAARLVNAWGLTPAEATRYFLAFIAATEGNPAERLERSLFGQYDGA